MNAWYNDEDDVFDPDEADELLTDSELFVEAPKLQDTEFTLHPRDIYRLDTDALLESLEELPYEFRCYLDTKRAFAKALRSCRDEIADFESYTGGRSASYETEFDYDDVQVTMNFTLSKESDSAPFAFSVRIQITE